MLTAYLKRQWKLLLLLAGVQLALGLVAILLRHQQHAPALSGERRAAYLVHDQRGLARARPARYESQHVLASLGPTIIP